MARGLGSDFCLLLMAGGDVDATNHAASAFASALLFCSRWLKLHLRGHCQYRVSRVAGPSPPHGMNYGSFHDERSEILYQPLVFLLIGLRGRF